MDKFGSVPTGISLSLRLQLSLDLLVHPLVLLDGLLQSIVGLLVLESLCPDLFPVLLQLVGLLLLGRVCLL